MDSVSLALAFYRQPFSYPGLLDPANPLPRGIDTLLMLAVDARLPDRSALTDVEESRLAARFFVQQVFFVQDASHYRVLGLNPDADDAEIKKHHRLLMRLFHPDRRLLNQAWADSYAQRINEAYTVLRRGAGRHRYDLALRASQVQRQEFSEFQDENHEVLVPHGDHRVVGIPVPRSMGLPAWVIRRLPETVLGVVGIIALLSVGGVYLSQRQLAVPVGEAGATTSIFSRSVPLPLMVPARPALIGDTEMPLAVPKTTDSGTPSTPVTPATPDLSGMLLSHSETAPSVPPPVPRPEQSAPAPVSATVASSRHDVSPPIPRARPQPPTQPPSTQPPPTQPPPTQLPPTPTVTVAASPPSITLVKSQEIPEISRLDVEVMTSLFIGAYERGDIEAMMTLFADGVGTANQLGKAGIRREYQTLFNTTEGRTINLSGMQWVRQGQNAQGSGVFEVRLKSGGQVRNYGGTLQLEVEKRADQLLITGFYHRDLYSEGE